MTTTGKRRRCLSGDSPNASDGDRDEKVASSNKCRDPAEFSSARLIVSERQQLAVLKQLTATDESTNISPSSSTTIPQQQRPTKLHRRNEHGETVVHIAARKGDFRRLKKALKEGANVNEEDNAGWTPLHEAVTKNQFKAANLLLKSGANANASGPEEQTPLLDAILNNNTKMVGLLLKYSADSSTIDFTRVNETMFKILKGKISTSDLSENDNDDQSMSPSSSITSFDDDYERDERKTEGSSFSSSAPPVPNDKLFHEHSSDSLTHHQPSIIDKDLSRKNPYDFLSDEDEETIISVASYDNHDEKPPVNLLEKHSISKEEYMHQTYRVPPLKIVLARTTTQKKTDIESMNMEEDNTSMETSSLSIIEQNERFLSPVITSTEFDNKVTTREEEQGGNDLNQEENNILSTDQTGWQISEIVISSLIDDLLSQIESNLAASLTSAEDPAMIEEEKAGDSKITMRTLRSHARRKLNTSNLRISASDNRRASNRKRTSENKFSSETNEKFPRKKQTSERSSHNETSSNSDDQTPENPHNGSTMNEESNNLDDDGSSSNNSTVTTNCNADIEFLPPNKRRLREQNAALRNSSETSSPIEENLSNGTTTTRGVPTNGIKQYLEIRQQINKRHETMLHDFVLPKVPKDFAKTLMAKKNYLITPSYKSFPITTPASLGIKRLHPPSELDSDLADVFLRLEGERYRMKLRHQVERDKLNLSHEQEILRLYGNATRSLINQEIPFSYCSLLKDNEVYNNPSLQERSSALPSNDYTSTELGKRGKNRWNGRSFIKWFEDSNLKYKRLSCEINQRQHLEANTLYSMQRMVWLKHLPKEILSSSRINSLLSEYYLPKVEINTNFWTYWEATAT